MKIPYRNKATTANTVFTEMSESDKNWIEQQCNRIISIADRYPTDASRLNDKNPNLPRHNDGIQRGMNTPKSFCEGVVDKLNLPGLKDLSTKQMDGLVEAFRIGEELIEDFESVEFEEVDKLPKLKSVNTVTQEDSGTTMFDLFEVESITVTYGRKES